METHHMCTCICPPTNRFAHKLTRNVSETYVVISAGDLALQHAEQLNFIKRNSKQVNLTTFYRGSNIHSQVLLPESEINISQQCGGLFCIMYQPLQQANISSSYLFLKTILILIFDKKYCSLVMMTYLIRIKSSSYFLFVWILVDCCSSNAQCKYSSHALMLMRVFSICLLYFSDQEIMLYIQYVNDQCISCQNFMLCVFHSRMNSFTQFN